MISLDPNSTAPLVTQLVDAVSDKIRSGSVTRGTRLPSVRKLAAQCGVSTLTVSNAYNRLVADGLLEARRASGYFVSARLPDRTSTTTPVRPMAISVDSGWLLRRVYEEDTLTIKAGCGWLPDSHLFAEGIKQALSALARRPDRLVSRYGHPLGYAPLRRAIQLLLAQRNIDCEPDQIILTHGASQALDLTMRSFLQPGDVALVDDPGYCNLYPSLHAMGVTIVGVERTLQGPSIAALQTLAERHKPKLFFTNTNFHNPTGTACSPATAYQILRIAEKHDFQIVEDDIYSSFVEETAPSIASLDQLGRVIHIGSFSKTISPSLRVGYLACNPDTARRLLHMKMAASLTSSELSESLVHSILTEGQYRLHIARLREKLATEQKTVADALLSAGLSLFYRPTNGLFLWAGFGGDLDLGALAQRAAAEGIMLAPGHLFRAHQEPTPWLRFNVAHTNAAPLFRFLETERRALGDRQQ
ncbi:PLP-dependent aminotransferase family protein [Methylobacterium sp. BTF04]|uniref:aminotransferase-like domain-containing protein n=1 Tax=Methylobacterium sp. BTF04 TaxID=2708300 RepID=UPI0013CFB1C6|nr:PLP-dependent aminotransferase family protein [Methylobacterium sp. BTF04]NEU13332.1 PLP-dependent aminotransferase family protein [Methylobacterium sp. BTF04]